MQKYVAFISGLPVGGGEEETEQIRSLMERLGFLNVATYRTRDNITFESHPVGVIGPLEAQISRHLKRSLGLEHVWTFIRTPEELGKVVTEIPFSADELANEENVAFVVLLSDTMDARTEKQLRIRRSDADTLVPKGKHVYWLRRETADAGPPPVLREIIDAPATVRSMQTLTRLANLPAKESTQTQSATESVRSRP